jgi:hypothetical protein
MRLEIPLEVLDKSLHNPLWDALRQKSCIFSARTAHTKIVSNLLSVASRQQRD